MRPRAGDRPGPGSTQNRDVPGPGVPGRGLALLSVAGMWLVVTKVPGQLGARAYAEFGVDAGQVSGDRLDAQEQLVSDLPVAASLGDQVGDAPLAFGQRITGRDAAADAGQFTGGLG